MRVFVGIQVVPEAREKIVERLKPFQKMKTPIHWAAAENIHLTLKFLGEVAPDLYLRVEKALSEKWDGYAPFSAWIRGFGKFPPGRNLSIFWAGMVPCPELARLQAELEKRLAAFPFRKEERPFVPHITLGRNKAPFNFKSLLEKLEEKKEERIAAMNIAAFQIFASTLTPQGPVYEVLKEIPLAE